MPTVYRSTDTDAPVLTGLVGSLIAVLDACLVNGYGDKAAAGWTKAFSGTNKAAYKNSFADGGSECLIRVDDASPNDGGNGDGSRGAYFTGYSSMSGIDDGSNPTSGVYLRKSGTENSTARPWIMFADGRTFHFYVLDTGESSAGERNKRFVSAGDYDPVDSGNAFNYYVMASNEAGFASGRCAWASMRIVNHTGLRSVNPDGITAGGDFFLSRAYPLDATSPDIGNAGTGVQESASGKFSFYEPFISGDSAGIMGKLRGLYLPLQRMTSVDAGEKIPGTDLVMIMINVVPSNASNDRIGGCVIDEQGPW